MKLHVQVDIRILKGTVLESNEIDAAVEFILTEVLEQPSTGKVDERLAKELISGSPGRPSLGDSMTHDQVCRPPRL